VEVGRHTYGHEQIEERHWGEPAALSIGSFCSVADRVVVFLGGNHRTDWVTTYPFPALADRWETARGIEGHPATNGDVRIGNDVWIGSNATILSGVAVGDGAVIGADSCVTRSIPPYAIVAGNPAVVLRRRFDQSTIEALLEIRWWDWSDEKIADNVMYLCSADIAGFVRRHGDKAVQ
jgi:acetyltransferase-like isoleucine patch superfamily enzyme